MDIKWLKTFIAAAKYENFRKTSEELFLTQPAITKHIKRLEEFLQIELFHRGGKQVYLSPAGSKFLPIAEKIIFEYEIGMESFEAWKQGYHRKLIIAVAPQVASSFLPPLLRDFIDQNPDIEVIINVLKSFEIGAEISAGRADLGLTRINPPKTNINSELIHKEPVILVRPYEKKETDSFNEEKVLLKYRLITHNHPEYWDRLLNKVKKHYPTVRTMSVSQVEVTKHFIEQGLGASYLPLSMVREELKLKKMVEVDAEKVFAPNSLTYLLTKVKTEEVNLFIEFLKEMVIS